MKVKHLQKLILLGSIAALLGCDGLDNIGQQNLVQGEQKVVPLELVIKNAGEGLASPTAIKLTKNVKALNREVAAMCLALESKDNLDDSELALLRAGPQKAWKEAMLTYHRLEMFQFGPVTNPLSITMKNLYTFDGSTKCSIEGLLRRSTKPLIRPTNEKGYQLIGLDTFEHLLFIDSNKSLCVRQIPNSWFSSKNLLERQRDVCGYLQYIGSDLTTLATKLEKKWSPKTGDYTSQMLTDNILGSKEETISHISQALFYLYGEVSDLKIATPAGIELFNNRVTQARGCTSPCPAKAEHPYAKFSIEALIASLDGFSLLYNGTAGSVSFDDLVDAQGYPNITNDINQAIATAKRNLEKLKGKTDIAQLAKLVQSNECKQTTRLVRTNELCAIRKDFQAITDKLQEASIILSQLLSKPTVQQGDND